MKRVRKEGLINSYKYNDQFRLFVTKMSSISLAPINDVPMLWEQLKLDIGQNCEKKRALVEYFESTYIGSNGREARFPIPIWNTRAATISCTSRTTNCCESFHNRLKIQIDRFHPSIETFLRQFPKVIAEARFVRIENESLRPIRRPDESRLSVVVAQYDDEISKTEFLDKVAKMMADRRKKKKPRVIPVIRGPNA